MNSHDSISQTRPIGGALRASLLPRRICERAGFTLIELLVVVTIVLMLFGLAATVMQPLRAGRDVREAASMVSAYLTQAQTRAIQRGRPVGIRIGRLPTQPDMALDLAMAEVLPPYGGDTFDAVAVITWDPVRPERYDIRLAIAFDEEGEPIFADLSYLEARGVHMGDLIRFGYKGPLRRIDEFDKETDVSCVIVRVVPPLKVTFDPAQGSVTQQLPYQIYRYSMAQSPFDPLTLPASVAIDVANSGIGKGWFAEFDATETATTSDPVILFGPDGSVDRVITGLYDDVDNVYGVDLEAYSRRPLSTIHLLIGRPEKLGSRNLADGNNLWVSINKTTGKVTTSDIFPLTPQDIQDFNNGNISKSELLRKARSFATEGLSKSGG